MEEFLTFLPENEIKIVQTLRKIVLGCFPNPIEKLSYNVPYYYQHSRVCFIWPSTILWGNVKKEGVLLGFCKGYLLRDEINYLERNRRKQVFVRNFRALEDIDSDLVKTYIMEAILVDKQLQTQKR